MTSPARYEVPVPWDPRVGILGTNTLLLAVGLTVESVIEYAPQVSLPLVPRCSYLTDQGNYQSVQPASNSNANFAVQSLMCQLLYNRTFEYPIVFIVAVVHRTTH